MAIWIHLIEFTNGPEYAIRPPATFLSLAHMKLGGPFFLSYCFGPLLATAFNQASLKQVARKIFPESVTNQFKVIESLYGCIQDEDLARLETDIDELSKKAKGRSENYGDRYLLSLILKNGHHLLRNGRFVWDEERLSTYKDIILWDFMCALDDSFIWAKTLRRLSGRETLVTLLESLEDIVKGGVNGQGFQRAVSKIYYSDVKSFQKFYGFAIAEDNMLIDEREGYSQFMRRADYAETRLVSSLLKDIPEVTNPFSIPITIFQLIHSHYHIYRAMSKLLLKYLEESTEGTTKHPKGLSSFHHLFWYTAVDLIESRKTKRQSYKYENAFTLLTADLSWIKRLDLEGLRVLSDAYEDSHNPEDANLIFNASWENPLAANNVILEAFFEWEKNNHWEPQLMNSVGKQYRKAMGMPFIGDAESSLKEALHELSAALDKNFEALMEIVDFSQVDPLFLATTVLEKDLPYIRFLCKFHQHATLKSDVNIRKAALKHFVQGIPFDPYMRVMLETIENLEKVEALFQKTESTLSYSETDNGQAVWDLVISDETLYSHFKSNWGTYFFVHPDMTHWLAEEWSDIVGSYDAVFESRTTEFLKSELGERLVDSIQYMPVNARPTKLYQWIPYIEASDDSWTIMRFLLRNGAATIDNPLDPTDQLRDLLAQALIIQGDVVFNGRKFLDADTEERRTILPLLLDFCRMSRVTIPNIFTKQFHYITLVAPESFKSKEELFEWAKARSELLEQVFAAANLHAVVGELDIPDSPYRQQLLSGCKTIQEMEVYYRKAKKI